MQQDTQLPAGTKASAVHTFTLPEAITIQNIDALAARLKELKVTAGETARKPAPKPTDPLMNGPQLSSQAPTQAEVDQMFTKAKP